MKNFIQHWKKGWKVLLMLLCIVFVCVLLIIPIDIITFVVLSQSKVFYYSLITIAGLIFAPALTQYIFELFFGGRSHQQNK